MAKSSGTHGHSIACRALAWHAALSLENARLYAVLRREYNERRISEAALRRSEERYACAVEAAGDGHAEWIVATDAFYASPKLLEICGFPTGTKFAGCRDFVARFPFDPEDRARVLDDFHARLGGAAKRHEFELRILRDGQTRLLHVTSLYSRDGSSKLIRVNGAVADITERRNAEDETLRMQRQLNQAQRRESIGILAGGIAHDFKNILACILGFGERARSLTPEGGRVRQYLDNVLIAGRRGTALVEQILTFSGSGVAKRVAVHVEAVVHEALELIAVNLPPRIRIESRFQVGRAAMLGDPTQIHQVTMNLAMNACQAMGNGTLRVELVARNLPEARSVTTGLLEPGDYIVLTVADEGRGMAPDVLERIFDPFFTTKGAGVGAGLGLSVVRGIVMEVGGAIEVESKVGEGSVFSVYLPRWSDVEAPPELG